MGYLERQFEYGKMDIKELLERQDSAFTLSNHYESMQATWLINRHHLAYAVDGLFTIEVDDAIWRLPPSRAAWIPADVEVQVRIKHPIHCFSVFFHRDFVEPELFQCRVFPVSALAREMILYSQRWQNSNAQDEAIIQHFYASLAHISRELFQDAGELYLPKATSSEMKNLLEYVLDNLDQTLMLPALAEMVGLSGRTASRRFSEELHMVWSQYLHRARMIKALEYLADGYNVTETAVAVGFQSVSAFSTAFRKFADLSPTQYLEQFA